MNKIDNVDFFYRILLRNMSFIYRKHKKSLKLPFMGQKMI